jgi:hypothetical protein
MRVTLILIYALSQIFRLRWGRFPTCHLSVGQVPDLPSFRAATVKERLLPVGQAFSPAINLVAHAFRA